MARKRGVTASSAQRTTIPAASTEGVAHAETLPTPAVTYDWCVDHEGLIAPMRLVDLWSALASGEVDPMSRVWREGMECWTPAAAVPDVACAIPPESMPTPSPLVVDADGIEMSLESFGERAALSSAPSRVARRGSGHDRVWAAAGAVIAAMSVVFAGIRFVRHHAHPIEPMNASLASVAAAVVAAVPPPTPPQPASAVATSPNQPAALLAQSRHVERGQRRRRR